MLDRLLQGGIEVLEPEVESPATDLVGLKFVLSGRLEQLTRRQAKELLESLGAKVSSAVSAKTDYVVAGTDPGSKYDRAKELGVTVLDEDGFLELLSARGISPQQAG